jgi:16S rRNA (guanine1516-N2)-methyltransferase
MAPVVIHFHPEAAGWVQRWRERFVLVEAPAPPDRADFPLLWAAPDHLELRIGPGRNAGAWVTESEVYRRARQAPELLRACGAKSGMQVLDAMSGWGLDGLVLAAAGARVTMVEREPRMQALQEDLVRRVCAEGVVSVPGDGFLHLDQGGGFDIVYLDPMFPLRGKQALPGKRMQYLALLAAPAPDDYALDAWVERAVRSARHRVVVKRRLHDTPSGVPDWQIKGRTIRYDVYRGLGT